MANWAGVRDWFSAIPVLRMTALGSAAILLLLLALHLDRYGKSRHEVGDVRLDAAVERVEARMAEIVRAVDGLRQEAATLLAVQAAAPELADGPLLRAFLASNPADEVGRSYSLDRLPAPFVAEHTANLLGLSTAALRRRTGLSRPEGDAWHPEAAMAAALGLRIEAVRRSQPAVRRLGYLSLAGLALIAPYEPGDRSGLLDSYPGWEAFRRAAPEVTTDRRTFWAGGDPDMVVLAAPLDHRARFLGTFVAETQVQDLLAGLPQTIDGARVLPALLDAGDRLLGHAVPESAGDVPNSVPLAALAPGSVLPAGFVAERRSLAVAPGWQLVLLGERRSPLLTAFDDIAPTLVPVGILLMLGVGLSYAQVLRILRARERAAVAERAARAHAEKALADLRAAHDELDFLNREKTRFFSLISHDLRGPFNTLLGMTDELARHARTMSAEDVADFAESTHDSARKVYELLETLLQWSRVQMSGKPFQPCVFALKAVVDDAVREAQPAAAAKRVQVLDAVGDRWVLADRTMVLAIMRNLLANALKFSHPGGVVHLTSRAGGDRVELAVTDHGVGMPDDKAEALLSEGVSRPGTSGETGSGLGLKLVRDLALRHGGDLEIDSAEGRGTTVRFTLPLARAPSMLPRSELV